jgi:hypothetical protein
MSSDKTRIYLSDCLAQLSDSHDIRIFSKRTATTEAFSRLPALKGDRIKMKLGDDRLHEKGFLTPLFYFEGSMNITYAGVRLNTEKVVYHSGDELRGKLSNTYLEFDRRWKLLPN